jgi:hypothetical protein
MGQSIQERRAWLESHGWTLDEQGRAFDPNGVQRCGATSKTTGNPCKARPVKGRNRCSVHGGKTPRGAASASFKHGRYSSYLPDRLADRYAIAQADPHLLELSDDVALLDTRISDLLSQVQSSSGADRWTAIGAAVQELEWAINGLDPEALIKVLGKLKRIVRESSAEQSAWQDVIGLLEQRRRTVDSERKHRQQQQYQLTVEEAWTEFSLLLHAIRDNVDRDTLAAIQRTYDRHRSGTGANQLILDQRGAPVLAE